ALLRDELRAFYELSLMRVDLRLDHDDVLMRDALSVRVKRTQQRLFKLLALIYPPKTLDLVATNLQSPVAAVRANAVEILDNIMEGEHKRLIVPIAEDRPDQERVRVAVEELGLAHKTRGQWLEWLTGQGDRWLVTAALEMIGRRRLTDRAATIK